jgi:hypothetical protein
MIIPTIQTWIEKDRLLLRYIVKAGQVTCLVDIARATGKSQVSVFIDSFVRNGDYVFNL